MLQQIAKRPEQLIEAIHRYVFLCVIVRTLEFTEIFSCQGNIILGITYGTVEGGKDEPVQLSERTVGILVEAVSSYVVDAIPLSKHI